MLDRDYRDIFTGLALALIGGFAALYAAQHYSLGTVSRMGPAMVPVSLGVILAGFGLSIAIPGFLKKGDAIVLPFRPFLVISGSILAFAFTIETLGLVPAVFLTVVIATFAEKRVPLVSALLLGASMAFLTWAIFILGLGLPIHSFDWPF
ncbi:tripartite tricarboxylate transporter TctB family protein [Martelella mediterranea]|uniref:Tripartite tricarboxylate transporter TctB family protein n=1 Tax=Martelella mediterranea DSM 17316 TaxID=1122214 RepID=A0A1U9Z878_9HYPH|nr:tripartite tricarboxylate transporter TctB family protein [Martelella mediterranea]AQZ53846.1 Tripartite tricarboxylate transporter TctB family protein [Martelella mediterranea DSM 17316]